MRDCSHCPRALHNPASVVTLAMQRFLGWFRNSEGGNGNNPASVVQCGVSRARPQVSLPLESQDAFNSNAASVVQASPGNAASVVQGVTPKYCKNAGSLDGLQYDVQATI